MITGLGAGSASGESLRYEQLLASYVLNTCEFRLSLTTGVPVTTTDVTGATTIYCAPYKGNRIALYDGTNWNLRTSAQFSLALGTLTSGLPYDVFCYDNSGTPTLEFTAWTNGTTRATALTTQNGVLSKTGALTRRYLGTFYTTSTTATEDSVAKRFLWNYYNRAVRPMYVLGQGNYDYTLGTIRQAGGGTTNQLAFIIGVAEDAVSARVSALAANTSAGVEIFTGIGVNTTTDFTTTGATIGTATTAVANYKIAMHASLEYVPSVGYTYLSHNEKSTATGTTHWEALTAFSYQVGIMGRVLA